MYVYNTCAHLFSWIFCTFFFFFDKINLFSFIGLITTEIVPSLFLVVSNLMGSSSSNNYEIRLNVKGPTPSTPTLRHKEDEEKLPLFKKI